VRNSSDCRFASLRFKEAQHPRPSTPAPGSGHGFTSLCPDRKLHDAQPSRLKQWARARTHQLVRCSLSPRGPRGQVRGMRAGSARPTYFSRPFLVSLDVCKQNIASDARGEEGHYRAIEPRQDILITNSPQGKGGGQQRFGSCPTRASIAHSVRGGDRQRWDMARLRATQ
jgi:hypothetical protein